MSTAAIEGMATEQQSPEEILRINNNPNRTR